MQRISQSILCAAAVAALGGLYNTSFGQSVSFSQQSGNWNDPNTWDSGVPSSSTANASGSGSGAVVNNGNNVTVNTADSANFTDVAAAANTTGTLTISGGSLTVDDPAGSNNMRVMRVGEGTGSTGTVNQTGGTVTINGANNNTVDGHLYVGDFGTGVYNLSGGSVTASDEVFVGIQSGSTGTISVSGGTLSTSARAMLLGLGAANSTAGAAGPTATLNVSNTGAVSVQGVLFSGFGAGSTATINVTGGSLSTVGDNMLLGFAASTNTMTLSGTGAVNTNFFFAGFNAGSTFTATQTGGTLSALGVIIGERGTATYNHSAGTISPGTNPANTANASVGDFTVGEANGGVGTYNISGTAKLTVPDQIFVGRFAGSNGTINQTAGTISTGAIQVGGNAPGTYTMSGGTLTQTGTVNAGVAAEDDNFLVGRNGTTGSFTQTGGTVSVATNVFLGDFDNSNGTYSISGGTLRVTGNLNVGGAQASNAGRFPPGFALNAVGNFIDSGSAATISVAGNLNANAATNTRGGNRSNLTFNLASGGVSVITVGGVADLNGAVIDVNTLTGVTLSPNTLYKLIDAGSITGAFTQFTGDSAIYRLTVANDAAGTGPGAGGSGQSLYVSLVPEPTSLAVMGMVGVGLAARRRRAN